MPSRFDPVADPLSPEWRAKVNRAHSVRLTAPRSVRVTITPERLAFFARCWNTGATAAMMSSRLHMAMGQVAKFAAAARTAGLAQHRNPSQKSTIAERQAIRVAVDAVMQEIPPGLFPRREDA